MIRPIKDRVVVKPDSQEEVTAAGVFLPQNAEKEQFSGEVLAAGPECREIKEGDKIVYSRYAGIDVDEDGEELLILREPDVFGVKT